MNSFNGFLVRPPIEDDQPGIRKVIQTCEPFLTLHNAYIWYRDIHCNAVTCRVAEATGQIIGYCSTFPISGSKNKFFFHQLGVDPCFRKYGVAKALILSMLAGLRQQANAFELEFTVNVENEKVLGPIVSTAKIAGMEQCVKLGFVQLFEEGLHEQMYLMTFPAQSRFRKRESTVADLIPRVGRHGGDL